MKSINRILVAILLILISCTKSESNLFETIKVRFEIESNLNWILVVNPSGCKTCLDVFFRRLEKSDFNKNNGALLITSRHSKELKSKSLFQNPSLAIYFDQNQELIKKGWIDKEDELVLIYQNNINKFNASDGMELIRLLEEYN